MESIEMVEYSPKWAAAVANMWNESSEGWNGEQFNKTTESVLREEEASSALNVFLAVDGERAVGYCSLMRDQNEPDALYVALLNVRPEYHGRKIGKALMLRALERTRELGVPKLFLHTWAGNTKAVPLYKKVGFFWEDGYHGTHLLNFMPHVLANPLVAGFFATADWYADSVREIKVEPDGRRDNGFDFFTYAWKKDGRSLEMEYCRHGRGLRRVCTNDWSLCLAAPKRKLAFGRSYEATLTVENRSGAPLHICLQGQNEGLLRVDWADEADVTDTRVFTGRFRIEPIEREEPESIKHDCLCVRVTVNGVGTDMRLGIAPRFPAAVYLAPEQRLFRQSISARMWLNMINNTDESLQLSCRLPEHEDVTFSQREFTRDMEPKGRGGEPLTGAVNRACLFNAPLPLTVRFATGEEVSYVQPGSQLFATWDGCVTGTTASSHILNRGPWQLNVGRQGSPNRIALNDLREDITEGNFCLMPPQMGRPYSEEFSQEECPEVTTRREGEDACLRMVFRSPRYPGVLLRQELRLAVNGMLSRVLTVENHGEEPVDLWVQQSMWFNENGMHLPHAGGVTYQTPDHDRNEVNWDMKDLREPWLFCKQGEGSIGIIWDSSEPLMRYSWDHSFECNTGLLAPGGSWSSKPVLFARNVFTDWRSLRTYAMGGEEHPQQQAVCELVAPAFAGDKLQAQAWLKSRLEMDGSWELAADNGAFEPVSAPAGKPAEPVALVARRLLPAAISRLQLRLQGNFWQPRRSAVVFHAAGEVTLSSEVREGHEVFAADNGVLRIEAAPTFLPGIFRLRGAEEEWLTNTFPTPTMHAWWNPWCGGMFTMLGRFNMKNTMKEKPTCAFAEVTDSAGNIWKGLRVDVNVTQDEDWRGHGWSQLFLLLPGAPVLLVTELVRRDYSGYGHGYRCETEVFYSEGLTAEVGDGQSGSATMRPGKQMSAYGEELMLLHGKNAILHCLAPDGELHTEMYVNADTIGRFSSQSFSLRGTQEAVLPPCFYILAEERLNIADLRGLRALQLVAPVK